MGDGFGIGVGLRLGHMDLPKNYTFCMCLPPVSDMVHEVAIPNQVYHVLVISSPSKRRQGLLTFSAVVHKPV